MRVQYNGNLYESNWYSQNQNPEQNSGQFQTWTLLGSCGSSSTGAPTAVPTIAPTIAPTSVPTIAPTNPPAGALGDVNSDGTVSIVDALLTAQYYVGLNPSGFVAANADVNCSGGIDIVDALRIAQYYVGLITVFC
jgi:hypothetical protein